MSLNDLSHEVHLLIAEHLPALKDVNACCRVNHRYHDELTAHLYQQDAKNAATLSNYPRSALYWSVENKQPGTMKLAVANAGAWDRDREGATPLSRAVEQGEVETMKLLLSGGMKANVADQYGQPLICLACERGPMDSMKLLLENGADPMPDAPEEGSRHQWSWQSRAALTNSNVLNNGEQTTPLHAAVARNHCKVIRYLIQKGARLSPLDDMNCTPLEYAIATSQNDTIPILVEEGAQVAPSKIARAVDLASMNSAPIADHRDVCKVLLFALLSRRS